MAPDGAAGQRPRGEFRTTVQLAADGRRVLAYLTLKAGYAETRLTRDVAVDVHPPNVLFGLVDAPDTRWRVGGTAVAAAPLHLHAEAGAGKLLGLLDDPRRTLPVVAVSEYQGELLDPDFAARLARELCGLAVVARLDEAGSRAVTAAAGREWSCFHGAVRLYWPGLARDRGDPFHHNLFTASRIQDVYGDNRKVAARKFVEYLYGELRRLSTFSVRCPDEFAAVRQASHAERLADLRKQLVVKRDATQQMASKAEENRRLRDELAKATELLAIYEESERELRADADGLRDQVARLQTDLENERAIRTATTPPARGRPAPVTESEQQVQTVKEAVDRAKDRFRDRLAFGADVDAGVLTLVPEAGPPDRVLMFLGKLADCAAEMRRSLKASGTARLGTDVFKWLTDQGAETSPESRTVRNDADCQRRRTWDWRDGQKALYHLHMKPSDGTDPGRCVRIYFGWCDDRKKFVVGWVGRHPD